MPPNPLTYLHLEQNSSNWTVPIKPASVRGLKLLSVNASQVSATQPGGSNWTVIVSVNLTIGYVASYTTTDSSGVSKRLSTGRRALMSSSLDSWAQEDLFALVKRRRRLVGEEVMMSAEVAGGMSAAFGHHLPLDGSGQPRLRSLLFHDPGSPEALVIQEALRSPYGRIASAWVRQQAMPALARARRELASSLQHIELLAERMELQAADVGNIFTDDWEQFSAIDGDGSRRSLLGSNFSQADTITLAQIMSVLSSLTTLNVSVIGLPSYGMKCDM